MLYEKVEDLMQNEASLHSDALPPPNTVGVDKMRETPPRWDAAFFGYGAPGASREDESSEFVAIRDARAPVQRRRSCSPAAVTMGGTMSGP